MLQAKTNIYNNKTGKDQLQGLRRVACIISFVLLYLTDLNLMEGELTIEQQAYGFPPNNQDEAN